MIIRRCTTLPLSFPRRLLQGRRLSFAPTDWTMNTPQAQPTVRKYEPPHQEWPYSISDFRRDDERIDTSFYAQPRFLAHIDEAALERLTAYYHEAVPLRGNVLDFCTSWRSWYAPAHEKAVANGELKVFGVGMSNAEMEANPLFNAFADRFRVLDLNTTGQEVDTLFGDTKFDCATCTVSIDYIVDAVDILSRVKTRMQKGGKVHLAISNRCFPTKAVRIWLGMSTEERLGLVCGNYFVYECLAA